MSFMNKMLNFVGFDSMEDEYEEEDFAPEERYSDPYIEDTQSFSRRATKAVPRMPQQSGRVKLVVMQPAGFEEARDIANHIKARKPVVINLEAVDRDVARRIVDFLSGSIYALDGSIQKVSNGIFLIAPHNVDIMTAMSEAHSKGSFPWA